MNCIFLFVIKNCNEGVDRPRMLDIGAGLGKPVLHAALLPFFSLAIGVEVGLIRFQVSY
jgi:hypothetical protein